MPTLTERTRFRRLPERGTYDSAIVHSILDAAYLAHVGFAVDQQPFVIPTLYGREDETLYLHGSPASRMLRQLAGGIPACVTVTLVDGIVLARSAYHHSMNYRSVIAFGTCRRIDDPLRKEHALRVISEHLIAGRWAEVRAPSAEELKATAVLEFVIEEASAKIRTGPPVDDDADRSIPVWAGVLPLQSICGKPEADSPSSDERGVPEYVKHFRTGRPR